MKPRPNKHELLADVLNDVYFKRIEKYIEIQSIYEREWVRGLMTYEHMSELSQEVNDAHAHADMTISHILRKDLEREAQETVKAFLTAIPRNVEPPLAYSSRPPRSLVEQHSPPNLSRHLSSNAPPSCGLSNDLVSASALAYCKGNAHHT